MCQISGSNLPCGFRLVSSTPLNVISRGLPIFGSFCRPLRNVITETIVEPSENWEVSSNRILTGTISRPSCPFVGVKLVIQGLTCNFQAICSTRQNVISRGLPIFGSFSKPLENYTSPVSVKIYGDYNMVLAQINAKRPQKILAVYFSFN